MKNELLSYFSRELRSYLTVLFLLIFTGFTSAQQKQKFVSLKGKSERITAPLDKIGKTSMYGKPLVITRVGAGFAEGIPSVRVGERAMENRKHYPSDNKNTAEELVRKAIELNNKATLNAPVSTTNVNIDGQTATGFAPSDNNLAVGPNHVIQIINHSSGSLFKVWNKSGGVVQASAILSTITGLSGNGDPISIYDQLASRWYYRSSVQHLFYQSTFFVKKDNSIAMLSRQTIHTTIPFTIK